MTTARDAFRAEVAEALTDWRLGCIPPRPDWNREQELLRDTVAALLTLRLSIAYNPLFQGLQRIENRVNILAQIREDPYAPPRTRSAGPRSGLPASASERRYQALPVPD